MAYLARVSVAIQHATLKFVSNTSSLQVGRRDQSIPVFNRLGTCPKDRGSLPSGSSGNPNDLLLVSCFGSKATRLAGSYR